jgi:hypothetical protein
MAGGMVFSLGLRAAVSGLRWAQRHLTEPESTMRKKLLQNTLFAAMAAWALYSVQVQAQASEAEPLVASAAPWGQR